MVMSDTKTEQEWRAQLSPDRFAVLRQGATEPPFSGELCGVKAPGRYNCGGCGVELFGSETKFDSRTGWPSFFQPVSDQVIAEKSDTSHGMVRTEVLCAACGGHLGHVFDDGPPPTNKRYCINSLSLEFSPADE